MVYASSQVLSNTLGVDLSTDLVSHTGQIFDNELSMKASASSRRRLRPLTDLVYHAYALIQSTAENVVQAVLWTSTPTLYIHDKVLYKKGICLGLSNDRDLS